MSKAITSIIFILLFTGCKSKDFRLTEEYIYNPKGFSTGFSIHALKVKSLDDKGLPELFEDSFRVDLVFTGISQIQNKIYFANANNNYYWTKNLTGKYPTMPIEFEKGVWYGLWGDFKTGFSNTEIHNFFLLKNDSGTHIYKRIRHANF